MKRIFAIITVLAMLFALSACGQKAEAPVAETTQPPAQKEEVAVATPTAPALPGPATPITLKISTSSNASENHTLALEEFKKQIESTTQNITVEIHHSSSLFAQDANVAAMMRGNLEMSLVGASYLGEQLPYLNMFKAAYVFRDYDHMSKVLNGEIGQEVFEDCAQQIGIRPLVSLYIGSRTINLVEDKEITCKEDLKGVSLRVANSESWIHMCNALGANPVPMALNETYLSLQTGGVDGQDNPLPATMAQGFGEVTKSITMTNHIVDSTWLCITEEIWQSFDAETQAAVMAAAETAREFCDNANLTQIEDLKQQFRDMGLSVYEPDLSDFAVEVFQYYIDNPELSGTWDLDLYNRICEVE